ncbi:MAG: phosphorybosylanthranilate isomerase [Cyanobacteria bacterium QS_8_64_29]|nr:MAG: phosphorybosylanthranilate isomerase [Cyanobacteria bacterium QS_8_64_29]
MELKSLFQTETPIVGVVHLLPLPSSARWGGDLQAAIDRAEQEATALAAGGVDGILVENFFDTPFEKEHVDPAVVSAMTLIVQRLQSLVVLPVGINVLRNDAHSAMAIASCTGANFIRVNVLTGVMATDRGLIEGPANQLLRYRRELGSQVAIWADVLVKHAQPLGRPNWPAAVRETLERGLADAAIVTGPETGEAPSLGELRAATDAAGGAPVLIGSGADCDNVAQLLQAADGVIAATSLKRHGRVSDTIDPIRVSQFAEAARAAATGPEESQSSASLKLSS